MEGLGRRESVAASTSGEVSLARLEVLGGMRRAGQDGCLSHKNGAYAVDRRSQKATAAKA